MSSGPLQSSLWYRVAALRPQLAARARVHRHRYRGEVWYVLQDPASGRSHRFNPAARLVLGAMDGRRSVDEIWRLAERRLGDDAPTQDDLIGLLGQLHAGDLLATDVPPDAREIFERARRTESQKRRRSWTNPMALRVPLWDPGRFLDRHAALWRAVWGPLGALAWLAVVLPALALLPQSWPELTHNLSDRVLQADNLLVLALVFPLTKFLHEMGHASATRAAGGEVHDMGLMLLVLMPVPYVDASSASVVRSRWRRATVGAAGMLVELFVAALAFYAWRLLEPGPLRAACFNAMLVAGVSTIVFNGNPLLRYDAYYILADLIEMPNLAQRAARYWGYLAERYVLRGRHAVSPAHTTGERVWLAFYGLASTVYRLFVTAAIALFIGSRFFFFGVVLALWSIVAMVVLPVVRALGMIRTRPGLRERRVRIAAAGVAALALLVAALGWVPAPHRIQADGVVWLPEGSALHAGSSGFVDRVEATPGQAVAAGDVLIRSVNPALDAEVKLRQARVDELEATYGNEIVADRARAQIVAEQLALERDALERLKQRDADLVTVAAGDGIFTLVKPDDLPGRYHRQGEVLGHVLPPDARKATTVRVVLEQSEVDAVTAGLRRVELRLADDVARAVPAHVVRQVPAGTDEAPSRALLAPGGGRLAADPRDPQGRKTLARFFEVDVAPDAPLRRAAAYGQRVHLRFDLEPLPVAVQLGRALRRLFLAHFSV